MLNGKCYVVMMEYELHIRGPYPENFRSQRSSYGKRNAAIESGREGVLWFDTRRRSPLFDELEISYNLNSFDVYFRFYVRAGCAGYRWSGLAYAWWRVGGREYWGYICYVYTIQL